MSVQKPQKCEATAFQGAQELQQGNLQKAWMLLQSACDDGCQNRSFVHITFGGIYEKSHFIDKAFAAFDYAISCTPLLPQAYNNRGRMYLMTKQVELAFLDFEKTISLQPNNARAYFNLAGAHLQQRNFEKAIPLLKKAKELGYSPAHKTILDVQKQISAPTDYAEPVQQSPEEEQIPNAFLLAKFAYGICGRNFDLSSSQKTKLFGLRTKEEISTRRIWDTSIEKLYEFSKNGYQQERIGATLEFFGPSNFLIRVTTPSLGIEKLSLWKKKNIEGVPNDTFTDVTEHTWEIQRDLLLGKLSELIQTGIIKKDKGTLIYP